MAQVIQIGNSKGIRIPQAIIKQTGFENKELVFKVVPEGLLITPVQQPRAKWAEQVQQALSMHSNVADQEWLDADLSAEDLIW
jgi:antitoxin MazE